MHKHTHTFYCTTGQGFSPHLQIFTTFVEDSRFAKITVLVRGIIAVSPYSSQLEAMGGCGVEEPGLGNYGEQQQSSSAAEDSQRLQEIDEKLAELRKSSTQPQVRNV